MTPLTEAEISLLQIENFIFHVVHHGPDRPILLDETPLGTFQSFFLDRVRETLRGNRFAFLPSSVTCAALRQIHDNPNRFVDTSKLLAQAFHTRRDKRIKPGVLIVMALSAGNRKFFSLIKYDHEQVLAYDLSNTSAVLREVANSFTKAPDALHKSALIELNEEGGDLVVIDRTVRAEITDFFRGFLDVSRKYNSAEMTRKVEDILIATVKKHQTELPGEFTQSVRQRYYDAVQRRETFDPDQFFAEYFGACGTENIRATYLRLLEKHCIDGEVFSFDQAAVSVPKPKKFKTIEGVKLEVPEKATETFSKQETDDGYTVVSIRTRQLIEQ